MLRLQKKTFHSNAETNAVPVTSKSYSAESESSRPKSESPSQSQSTSPRTENYGLESDLSSLPDSGTTSLSSRPILYLAYAFRCNCIGLYVDWLALINCLIGFQ